MRPTVRVALPLVKSRARATRLRGGRAAVKPVEIMCCISGFLMVEEVEEKGWDSCGEFYSF